MRMYAKPTVDDFTSALTERGEQIGGDYGRALDAILSKMSAAGRLRSGATAKMVLSAARDSLDEGTNKLLADLQHFADNSDLDRDELRQITGGHCESLTEITLGVAQAAIDRLGIGGAAQAFVDEMKEDMHRSTSRKMRQFDIGLWHERVKAGGGVTSNTINAESINGPIQQGSHGSIQQVSQNIELGALPTAVATFEATLSECPPSAMVNDLRADIATLKSQLTKAQPNKGILQEVGKSIRSITEGITAGAMTPAAVGAAVALARLLGVA
jgi:hypothetical protein